MHRFIVNRFWACILALVLACCAIAGASHPVAADGGSVLGMTDGGDPSGGGGAGGGVTIGDPDVPTGSGKGAGSHGALQRPGVYRVSSNRGVDATTVWMLRLRVVLQTLGMRWLGI